MILGFRDNFLERDIQGMYGLANGKLCAWEMKNSIIMAFILLKEILKQWIACNVRY